MANNDRVHLSLAELLCRSALIADSE